ncbi:hypothetical protein BGW41_001775 [Actinomortierella wolfii]|nr:hypothetical protein BGW41_001775 [Actinomortierella wolfii]
MIVAQDKGTEMVLEQADRLVEIEEEDELDPERGGSNGQATCFICNERLFGSLEDINAHIDRCLLHPPTSTSSNSGGNNNGINTSSQGSQSQSANRHHEPFEEYEWAGQTRIRATALFEGGLVNLPGGSTSRLNSAAQTDVDDELNIEDDDEEEYGSAQFTERDVLLQNADAESEELREIVIGSSSPSRAPSMSRDQAGDMSDDNENDNLMDDKLADVEGGQAGSSHQAAMGKHKRKRKEVEIDIDGDGDGDIAEEEDDDEQEGDDDEEIDIEDNDDDVNSNDIDAMLSSAFASGDTKLVIEALKGKIRHLEVINKDVPMCLICLEPYKVPLTSIVCWHVHCEACWFRTLGTKKLCPQCQKITLPKDLRRIYL